MPQNYDSNISTNPSSSQQVIRQNFGDNEDGKTSTLIHLKQALSSQRQTHGPIQKKQLLVLSEKNIQNSVNASAGRVEAPRVPALERSEDNIILSRN